MAQDKNKTIKNETHFVFSDEFIGFTTIPNYIFKCKELSFKAIGIYCSILQYQNSDTHSISVKGLQAIHADGQVSVQNGMHELIKHGFIERTRLHNEDGTFKCVQYIVHMKPVVYQGVEPKVGNLNTENPNTVVPPNKKENGIKKKISKKENKDDDDTNLSTDKKNQSINQSSVAIDESFMKQVKEKWLEVTGKRLILSAANKARIMSLCAKFENNEVLEAINRISESEYLKQAITIAHFITKFEKVANGDYSTWTKVENNSPVAAAAQKKPNKFVDGCGDYGRDFDGLERLEAAKVAFDLGQMSANEYESIRFSVLGQ